MGFLCLWLFPNSQLFAQVKFGGFSSEELELEMVPFEPEAKIVVLYEEGKSYFMVNGLHTEYFYRVKILDENSEDFGNIGIQFFRGKSLVEDIVKLEAQVSYLEDNQRKVYKLNKNDFKEVNLGGGEFEYRIIFPHVKKGSILEWSYKKIDHQYSVLEGWAFEGETPKLISKYSFLAPDFFQYQMIVQGKRLNENNEFSRKKNTFSWTLRDIPSMPIEPFSGSVVDLQERVDGYLYSSTYINPNKIDESDAFYSSWNQVAEYWFKIPDVNSYFETDAADLKNYPKYFLVNQPSLNEIKEVYRKISREFISNSSRWLEPIYPMETYLEKKEGNSFDKNLLFVHFLRKNGINANLAMVNERGNGRDKVIEVPFINQFSSSIIKAEIEGKNYFLDLTDSIIPFGMVPPNKLVSKAFILEKDKGRLEDITQAHRSGSTSYIQLQTDSLGNLFFNYQQRFTDYMAIEIANFFRDSENKTDNYFTNQSNNSTVDFESIHLQNDLHTNQTITLNYKTSPIDTLGELILLRPFEFSRFLKNPFTETERQYPVIFDFPFYENFNISIPITAGFELEDFPFSETITIPSKKARFIFLVDSQSDELKVNCRLDILSDNFSVEEYPHLKFLFESVAAKLNTPIILKKINSQD